MQVTRKINFVSIIDIYLKGEILRLKMAYFDLVPAAHFWIIERVESTQNDVFPVLQNLHRKMDGIFMFIAK